MFASIRNTGARINEVLASPAMIFAAAALPVCAAGHAETALVKGRPQRRNGAASPGAVVRAIVSFAATDDGAHAEESLNP
jgi:hypothetical protein